MTLTKPERIPGRFPAFRLGQPFAPRFNLAPTQDVLAAKASRDGVVLPMRWGLSGASGRKATIVNARAETILTKPTFAEAVRERRAVVFADGYYEWADRAGGKQPYRFTLDGGAVFAFAGLWDGDGCAIATVAGNAATAFIDHDRMPAILADPASVAAWLADDLDAALAQLRPFAPARLTAVPVSAAVNRSSFEDPRAIEPVVLAEQTSLF